MSWAGRNYKEDSKIRYNSDICAPYIQGAWRFNKYNSIIVKLVFHELSMKLHKPVYLLVS